MNDKLLRSLFSPVATPDRQSREFQSITASPVWAPGRQLLDKIFNSNGFIEPHFIEQFQTSATDARSWELFLAGLFRELGFDIKNLERPDFELKKNNKTIFVEATVTQPSFSEPKPTIFDDPPPQSLREHEAAIKFGSSLYSKLKKEYWKLSHVGQNPIVLAVAAFHSDWAFHIADALLGQYLYAAKPEYYFNEQNELVVYSSELSEHEFYEKKIPSGFFNQPGAENISAVLFNNSGTLPKFNRLASQDQAFQADVLGVRCGSCYNEDPQAVEPDGFLYQIGSKVFPREDFVQGTVMFHNPNALYPVDPNLFPGMIHTLSKSESLVPDGIFHPYESKTFYYKGLGGLRVHDRLLTREQAIHASFLLHAAAVDKDQFKELIKFLIGRQ